MKRVAGWLAVLLAVMLLVTGAMSWGLPGEGFVAGPADWGEDGKLTVENRWLTSRIYTLLDGNIQDIYQESRLSQGREREISRVASSGEHIYFLRTLDGGLDWELVGLENNRAEVLSEGTFEQPMNVTGLRVWGNTVYITAVGENEANFVYEYTDKGTTLEMITPAWWLWNTVTAEFDGERFRAATAQGDTCFMSVGGARTYTSEAAEQPAPEVRARTAASWMLCKRTVLAVAAGLWLFIAATALLAVYTGERANRLAVRLTALGGEILLLSLLAAVWCVFWAVSRSAGSLLAAWQAVWIAGAGAAAVWAASLALLWGASGRMTRLIAVMTEQMDKISSGIIRPREVSQGRDELHRMDRAMQEMCMGLSIREYELQCTVRSYRRFVPQQLTELLARAAVAEVDLGDSRRVSGNVGLFSVGNRDEARRMLEDGQFVEFINHSFGIFYDCVEANRGWLLSSGMRLSSMEAMFPNSAGDGVRAGLDFLGQAKPAKGTPAPKPLLMLHQASFLYGVAGREERLFPYLSSAELEFLGSFAPRFQETGVRIVVTESYWRQLGDQFSGRYIGFVSDGEKSYKLYEILDAYPELERELRKSYDKRFQEALNLFYHNDFYLARGIFSSLLRASPEDGVARWYLFTCERFFNQENGAADYRLFSE